MWPRTVGIDSWLDSALLLIACFLPIVGSVWAIPRPRQGALAMISAVGIYALFCVASILEKLARHKAFGWDWAPFYMFVVPTLILAITIYLTSRPKHRAFRDDAI